MELINLPVTLIDINKYDENHRLVRFGNDFIVYNGNGYPTNYRGRTLTWSVTNLASFYYHGNYVEYMYFSDGRRSVKRVNGRTINYIYDHNRIVCENSVSTDGVESNMFYIYGIDGTVSCILKDASKHFLLRDQLGNVVAIVSDDGTLECSYQYDPYGNTIVYDSFGNVDLNPASIGNINPIRYRGYYYDVETGLYWLSSRYYDPEIGRFISPDGVDYLDPTSINGLNLYAYCNNDPVNYCDPSGHMAISTIIALVVIGLAVVSTAATITYGAITETPIVLDLSVSAGMGAGVGIKAGMSVVFDFKNGSVGFYPHLGYFYGAKWNVFGISYSTGIVKNYVNEGDYAGPFVDMGASYYGGVDICYDPRNDIENTVKAYSLTFGNNIGGYYGYDYYWYAWNIKFNKKRNSFGELAYEI